MYNFIKDTYKLDEPFKDLSEQMQERSTATLPHPDLIIFLFSTPLRLNSKVGKPEITVHDEV